MGKLSVKHALLVAAICCMAIPAYAIFGIGGNWALDFSTSMDNALGEAAVFDKLNLNISPFTSSMPDLPSQFQVTITGKDVPIIVDRTNFTSTPVNLGGKFYVDIIPVIDAIEISCNFYSFTYQGKVAYPDPANPFTINPVLPTSHADSIDFKKWVVVNYDTLIVGKSAFGSEKVIPFAKLQFDATIRKNLISFPPLLGILKLYAGGGPCLILATPVFSGGMIHDVLGARIDNVANVQGLTTLFADPSVQTEIASYALKQLFTPHMGFNIVAGAQVKPPLFPMAIYADFKFNMAGKLDKNVAIGGTGLTMQTGLALAF